MLMDGLLPDASHVRSFYFFPDTLLVRLRLNLLKFKLSSQANISVKESKASGAVFLLPLKMGTRQSFGTSNRIVLLEKIGMSH